MLAMIRILDCMDQLPLEQLHCAAAVVSLGLRLTSELARESDSIMLEGKL